MRQTKPSISNLAHNQQGMVSLIVTAILMIILTLITLSFSNVVRNEQRETLDRQLSTQAYYAAESGANYAQDVISREIKNGVPLASLIKTTCVSGGKYPNQLDSEGVKTSCLLVETIPQTLVYQLDPTVQSRVFPVSPEGPMRYVTIEWTPQDGAGYLGGCPGDSSAANILPKADGNWQCPFAVMRVDLTDVTNLSRDALAQNTFGNVFMPTNYNTSGNVYFAAGGRNAFSGGSTGTQGERFAAKCNNSSCIMTIKLPNDSPTKYYMRIQALYHSTTVTIKATNSAGNAVKLKDAQIIVDATGKAQDVLRRVQMRIPLVNDGIHADYAAQGAAGICKQFTVFPGYGNTTPGC